MLESRRALVIIAMANANKVPLLDGIYCNLIITREHRCASPRMALLLFQELTSIHGVKTKITSRAIIASKKVAFQVLLYMCSFFLTYIFGLVARIIQMQGAQVPYAVILLGRFFLPLQGFFNILMYTRPHIVSLRRNNPEYSWFKAFGIVFKSGGDNDSVGQSQRSSTRPASDADIRRRQERIERDHKRRMALIQSRMLLRDQAGPPLVTDIKRRQGRIEKDVNRRVTEIRRRSLVGERFQAAWQSRQAVIYEDKLSLDSTSSNHDNDDECGNAEILALDEEFGPNSANVDDDDALNDSADTGNSDMIHNNDGSEQIEGVVEVDEEIGSMSETFLTNKVSLRAVVQ